MNPAIYLVVYALAVARITRLVTADRITQAPRDAVIGALWRRTWAQLNARALAAGRSPNQQEIDDTPKPLLVYLIECPWCVSIYTGVAGSALAAAFGLSSPWLFWPALALAFSHATGLLAQLEK